MDTVFVVSLNGTAGTVARSMDAALGHVAAALWPGEGALMFDRSQHPHLDAVGAGGSSFHRVRHEAMLSRHESIAIVTHGLDAPPGHTSEVDRYDLCDACDPAFDVQSTLFASEESDETLDVLADALEESVSVALQGGHRFLETDEQFVERLRGYENLGDIRIIPDGDDWKAVIAAIPAAARAKFLEIALAAHPEEAPGATPR